MIFLEALKEVFIFILVILGSMAAICFILAVVCWIEYLIKNRGNKK